MTRPLKHYRVGVFVDGDAMAHEAFMAYVRDFSTDQEGCNIVFVLARDGLTAKRKAIEIIKQRLRDGELVNKTKWRTQ